MRQMAAHAESGSAGGLFLIKREIFFPTVARCCSRGIVGFLFVRF